MAILEIAPAAMMVDYGELSCSYYCWRESRLAGWLICPGACLQEEAKELLVAAVVLVHGEKNRGEKLRKAATVCVLARSWIAVKEVARSRSFSPCSAAIRKLFSPHHDPGNVWSP